MATHQIAQGIAQLGRNGDSTLVHMQPHEVAGLQAIAKANGTSLTINPETGLPEAFSLGGFFRSLAPTLAGLGVAMIPGMQPYALQAGIAAGAATGAITNKKNPLLGAAMGGLGGYGGANLAQAAGSFGSQAAKAGVDPSIAVINTPGGAATTNMIQPWQAEIGANMGATNITPYAGTVNSAGKVIGPNMAFNQSTAVLPQTAGIGGTATTGFDNALLAGTGSGGISGGATTDVLAPAAQSTFGGNVQQAYSNVASDPMKFLGENKLAVGMPLAGAVLSGVEPSDIYGDPMKPDTRGKYDPYASLNLNTDTGLKLYAQGGPVSFADGGDAMKGGGTDAMQGAGLLPLDVSDINAKYNIGEEGGFVPVPRLGLFADNDQIEAARSAYESQLASAMANRGGMGAPYGFGGMNRMMGGMGQPNQPKGLGSLGGAKNTESNQPSMGMVTRTIGSSAPTANTASTAETALTRLNLNKNYANGGSIQAGGLQDLYGTQDAMTGPMLSKEGYGLGRLQQLADGGVAGYAEGGETRYTLDKNTLGGRMFGDTGVIDKLPPAALAEILNNPGMRQFMGFRGVEEPKYYTASGMGGSSALSTTGPRVNLNTASGVSMAKGGYLDGPGDGMSDSIPATIEGKQPARLADGEFVVPADVVSHLGNGSTKAGSQRLYGMLDKVRKARTGTKKQGKQINPNKFLPA